ncbi:MAG: sulfite exporter TauE/SafE family protein [Bacteroidales bacterium]
MDWIQALLIGILGSFHCAGMCGPIALALPLKNTSPASRVLSSLIYNAGRIITYGILGLVFGLLGRGLYLGGLQQWTSIIVGAIMILSVVFPLLFKSTAINSNINKSFAFVKQGFSKFLSVRSYPSVLIIGLLNGLLPCGLVYIALAGAIVTGHASDGILFMVLFGLGTLPMMFILPLAGTVISLKYRKMVNKIVPYVIILIGVLFILRGLNLGIPYISPKIEHNLKAKCCHTK